MSISEETVRSTAALSPASTGEWPVVNQVEWRPFRHADELLEFCREHGIVLQAYRLLTRRASRRPHSIGRRHGKSAAQVLIRWNLEHGTIPLPKNIDGVPQ